ncbi:autotransporter-associated beta strand repeat-containing protein [Verrucomicrobiota bacterium sgz303538]
MHPRSILKLQLTQRCVRNASLFARSVLPVRTILVGAIVAAAASANAADGTWTNTAGGLWSNSLNWSSEIVADGIGATANFNTLDITAATTVNLDSSRTAGNLIFGDTTISSAANWSLANNLNAANILTLDVASGSPTITVNALGTNSSASISAVIAGNDGLTKDGAGILVLSGANTYTGATVINAGRLRAGNSTALGSGTVTVATGAGLELQNGINLANAVNLNGATALALNNGINTLSGPITLQSASTIALGSTNNASLEISGNLALGSNTLTASGSRPLTLSGTISGTGALNLNNITGTTIITNDNRATYSGEVRVDRSTLALGHDGAAGTGNIRLGVNDQLSGIRSTDTTARTLSNSLSLVGSSNSIFRFGSTTPAANGNLTFTDTAHNILLPAVPSGGSKFEVYNRTEFNAPFTGGGNTGITLTSVSTGTLVLAGANTYAGPTTVQGGTLVVSGSIAGSGSVTVQNSGSLLLGGTSDRIKDTALVTLGGGTGTGPATLKLDNSLGQISETVGALTLASSSILDFGTGSAGAILNFADSSFQSWTGTLSIYNWTLGKDQLFFGNSDFALTEPQLNSIIFYSDAGTTSLGSASILSDGQVIAAVPEPSTLLSALGFSGALICFRPRRRA